MKVNYSALKQQIVTQPTKLPFAVWMSKKDMHTSCIPFIELYPKKVHQKEKAASDSGVRGAGMYQESISRLELSQTKAFRKLTCATEIEDNLVHPSHILAFPDPCFFLLYGLGAFLNVHTSIILRVCGGQI